MYGNNLTLNFPFVVNDMFLLFPDIFKTTNFKNFPFFLKICIESNTDIK